MESVINEAFTNKRVGLVVWICIAIFVAFAIKGFASYGQSVLLNKIGNAIVAKYQKHLYNHLMALNLGYFSDSRSAQIAASFSSAVF